MASHEIDGVWDIGLESAGVAGVIVGDLIWVAGGGIRAYDRLSGALVKHLASPSTSTQVIHPYEGGLLAAHGTKVDWVDTSVDSTQRWFTLEDSMPTFTTAWGSVYVCTPGDGIQRCPPSGIEVDNPKGHLVGQYGSGFVGDAPLVGAGELYMPAKNGQLWFMKTDLSEPSSYAYTASATRFCKRYIRNGIVYLATSSSTSSSSFRLAAVDVTVNSLHEMWSQTIAGTYACADIVSDGSYVYVPCADNRVRVFSAKDGSLASERGAYLLEHQPRGRTLLFDGVLYFVAAIPQGSCVLYAIDTATGKRAFSSLGTNAQLLGIRDHIVYVLDSRELHARKLSSVLHEYYAEASMMQDFETGAEGAAPTPVSNFQTEVTLYDSSGAALVNNTVRVWAESPTTIMQDGVAHDIDAQRYVSLQTDSSGRVRIRGRTGNDDSAGQYHDGLHTPMLNLWAPFMDEDLRVVINPDAELHDQLANIQAEDLREAKAYDGSPMLNSEYAGADASTLEHSAGAVRSLATLVTAGKGERGKRSVAQRYLAPGCHTDVLCCCEADKLGCPIICERAFEFDLSLGASKLQLEGVDFERARARAGARLDARASASFWDGIKRGATKVLAATVAPVEDAVHAVVTTADAIVHVVVESVDNAIGLVVGVFNTIAASIEKVIQALSYVFNWDNIVANQAKLQTHIEGAMTALVADGHLAGLQQAVDAVLQSAKTEVDTLMQGLKSQIGGTSALAAQGQASGDLGKGNPASGGAKSNWLLGKLQDHLIGPSAGQKAAKGDSGYEAPDVDSMSFNMGLAIQDLMDLLERAVGKEVRDTVRRVIDDLDFSSPSAFLSAAASVFIDLVQGVVDTGIEVLDGLLGGVIQVIEALLTDDALLDWLRAEIDVPFLGALYEWLTGEKLSIYGVFTLVAAVPATLIEGFEKAFSNGGVASKRELVERPEQDSATPIAWLSATAGAVQSIWGVIIGEINLVKALFIDTMEGVVDYTTLPGGFRPSAEQLYFAWVSGLTLGALFVVRGLLLAPIVLAGGDHLSANIILWALPTITTLVDAGVAASNVRGAGKTLVLNHLFAAVIGFIELLVLAYDIYEDEVSELGSIIFTGVVGVMLIVRAFIAAPKGSPWRNFALAACPLLTMASGVVKLADGAVQLAEA